MALGGARLCAHLPNQLQVLKTFNQTNNKSFNFLTVTEQGSMMLDKFSTKLLNGCNYASCTFVAETPLATAKSRVQLRSFL